MVRKLPVFREIYRNCCVLEGIEASPVFVILRLGEGIQRPTFLQRFGFGSVGNIKASSSITRQHRGDEPLPIISKRLLRHSRTHRPQPHRKLPGALTIKLQIRPTHIPRIHCKRLRILRRAHSLSPKRTLHSLIPQPLQQILPPKLATRKHAPRIPIIAIHNIILPLSIKIIRDPPISEIKIIPLLPSPGAGRE